MLSTQGLSTATKSCNNIYILIRDKNLAYHGFSALSWAILTSTLLQSVLQEKKNSITKEPPSISIVSYNLHTSFLQKSYLVMLRIVI